MKTVNAQGVMVPAIGLGTWELRGDTCRDIVETALKLGYRHVDTAQMYQNEREVGEGMRASGVAREQIFLTTKIWPDCHGAVKFARAVDERLELLDCGPVDLLLLHWPSRTVPLKETITALNQARDAGLARHIGISNFTVMQVNEAVALSAHPLLCNQIEYHPLINQDKVLAACRAQGLAITAYCPIARNKLADEPVMQQIADRHGASPAEIALAWLTGQGDVMAIPRTTSHDRLKHNLAAAAIELGEDDRRAIDSLKNKHMRLVKAAGIAPDWD